MEATIKIRPLNAGDVFKITAIISKIGIDKLKAPLRQQNTAAILEAAKGNKDAAIEMIGINVVIDMAGVIIENAAAVQKQLDSFVADVAGLDAGDVKKLSPAAYADIIVQIVQSEDFADFIKVVSRLFK